MSLNVALLRKVQESIADTTQPFDMTDWCMCIAGHAYRLITGKDCSYQAMGDYSTKAVAEKLGLGPFEERHLFSVYLNHYNRAEAIARIEALIATHALGDRVAEPAPPVASAPEGKLQENVEELELVGA